ncbi:PEP-CTERM sorting domain-containing protein [Dapis sp. BLCC M229]|uniref:PEP-CTERM sorting domain-containing protein n=1 Tax=Dapis sp. BLCC M229 TaxID=3400188 RepID=UPI003CE7CCB0
MLKKFSIAAAGVTMISFQTIPAHAAQFNFTFDDIIDNNLAEPFVGSGVLSFDGDAEVGTYTLDSLSNLDMNFSFDDGSSFDIGDLRTNLSLAGISIFDLGAGELGLVFTGFNGLIVGGSIDFQNDFDTLLTFEPTGSIDNPIGCCGGDGVTNLYANLLPDGNSFETSFFGSYTAVSSVSTPEPASLLGFLGISILGASSLKRNQKEEV